MRIAVYAPVLLGEQISALDRFVVRTLLFFFQTRSEDSFIVINDVESTRPGPDNVEYYEIKSSPLGSIGKKVWWDLKLPKVLKKIKADLFISLDDRCSLTTSTPQSLLIVDGQKIKPRTMVKARSIVVFNNAIKKLIMEKYGVDNRKIFAVQPSPAPEFKAIGATEKEKIKELCSGDKEFFFYNHSGNVEDLVELLKAYSLFKKRLHSNLKLLVMGNHSQQLEHRLANYKYRADVVLLFSNENNMVPAITASAYAVLIPFNSGSDVFDGLNAFQAGSPVIASKNSELYEIAGESLLPAETKSATDISEKMIQIYIDENLRSTLIEKGKLIAPNYSLEKTGKQMWEAFMKALN
jgi:glycosyltransferase involved in cell wall biosynthesis